MADRIAFVTGAGSGIGRATAKLFASRGHAVALVDMSEAGGRETETAIRDLIVLAAQDSAEAAAAKSRFVEILSALAVPSQDREAFPSCKVVIARFERLEGHHQEAGLTN